MRRRRCLFSFLWSIVYYFSGDAFAPRLILYISLLFALYFFRLLFTCLAKFLPIFGVQLPVAAHH